MPRLYRSIEHPCPYLEGKVASNLMFHAAGMEPETWGRLLESGWRRFGILFFRPDCPGCTECKPIRIPANRFEPSGSQRKALKRNAGTEYRFINIREMLKRPPTPQERLLTESAWLIYKTHGEVRFNDTKDDYGTFIETFFTPAVDSLFGISLTNGTLTGAGFVDLAPRGLSSIYFAFDPAHGRLSPGTFSALKEMELARNLGLPWYYLGYWVPGCKAMAYKANYRPHELYDWKTETWQPA
jgi:arginine-tRNA-protein transferase